MSALTMLRHQQALGPVTPLVIPEHDIILLGRLFAANGLSAGMEKANRLLHQIGGLNAALSASIPRLRQVGAGEAEIRLLEIVRQTMLRALRVEAEKRPIFKSLECLVDYLYLDMARRPVEVFRVLFLDQRNRLVHDEVMHVGTLNRVEVHPRPILQRALEVQAAFLILSHNHPSGDHEPSNEDIRMTHRVIAAARELEIMVHDHLIVSRTGYSSLKQMGMMGSRPSA